MATVMGVGRGGPVAWELFELPTAEIPPVFPPTITSQKPPLLGI